MIVQALPVPFDGAVLDPLAPPSAAQAWEHAGVDVRRVAGPRRPRVLRQGGRLLVLHCLRSSELDERLVPVVAAQVQDVAELGAVLTGLVLSTVADPLEAWACYYRQSLAQLRIGATELAPIHTHAAGLVRGVRVLDLGSCFGFLALRLAEDSTAVIASDVSAGTMRLLGAIAAELSIPVRTLTCDASRVPLLDRCVDTVTAVHLLEHLDIEHGRAVVAEALRLADRRVVLAVPYEQTPNQAYGHVRTFTLAHLRELGEDAGPDWSVDVHDHHGGWAVLDRNQSLR
jgi:hypothetical protein